MRALEVRAAIGSTLADHAHKRLVVPWCWSRRHLSVAAVKRAGLTIVAVIDGRHRAASEQIAERALALVPLKSGEGDLRDFYNPESEYPPGHLRVYAHLMDIPWGQSWEATCRTKLGLQDRPPDQCLDEGINGEEGLWLIRCRKALGRTGLSTRRRMRTAADCCSRPPWGSAVGAVVGDGGPDDSWPRTSLARQGLQRLLE